MTMPRDERAARNRSANPARPQASPLRIPKAAEVIADSIRRDIVTGRLEVGQSLPAESGLMELFGVSRPTIREAYRILESEGLIELRRGARGAQIRFPTEGAAGRSFGLLLQLRGTTLAEMWDAQIVVEPALVGRLAKNRKRADLERLRESIEEHRKTISDPDKFALVSTEFHRLVASLSDNRALALLATVLDEVLQLHAAEVVSQHPEGLDLRRVHREGLKDHENLVQLIESQDSAGAEAFWRRHLAWGAKVMLNQPSGATTLGLYRQSGARTAEGTHGRHRM